MSELFFYELKKALSAPIIIALLVIFTGFNIFIIIDHAAMKDELHIVNKLAGRFGIQLDDRVLRKMKAYEQKKLENMNAVTKKETGKTYSEPIDFFKQTAPDRFSSYSPEQLDQFNETAIIGGYIDKAEGIDDFYDKLSIKSFVDQQIRGYQISGQAEKAIRDRFGDLDLRLAQLIQTGENKTLFFDGTVYGMHSLLFKTLFRLVIFEVMILLVLISGHIMTFEFEQGTYATVYASKRGRRIIWDKIWALAGASVAVTTLILGITLSAFFVTFDYSGLWHMPVSSYFNMEMKFPYITWRPLDFIHYLSRAIGIVYLVELLFTGIAVIIAMKLKNSYFVFFIFACLFGLAIYIPGLIPKSSTWIIYSNLTPFSLIMNPHLWFIGWSIFTPENFEAETLAIWVILVPLFVFWGYRSFRKRDLYQGG